MTTIPTQATHFSSEFPADSEFFGVHPLDESTAEDDALFLDGMDFIDNDAMYCGDDDDKIEPLQMNKQQHCNAIQEDDASYLLSNLQGAQQEDGATTITMSSLNSSSSSSLSSSFTSSSSLSSSFTSTSSSNGSMQRTTSINDQLQTLMASMKRTEETRKHIITQRQMLSPEQKTMLGEAKEQLKRSRLDFIIGSGVLQTM